MPVEISDFQLFSNLSFDSFVMHEIVYKVSIYFGANNIQILDAGLWILDGLGNVFSLSSIEYPATSISML